MYKTSGDHFPLHLFPVVMQKGWVPLIVPPKRLLGGWCKHTHGNVMGRRGELVTS